MHLAAPPVRKAFVGSVTDQGVAEAQVPVLLDEEVAEALPHVRRGRLRRERSIDEILREAGSNQPRHSEERGGRSGESWSILDVIRLSTESGSSVMPPAWRATAISSVRKSGFPPARSVSASIS